MAEGTTSFPTDAGNVKGPSVHDGTNFWHFRADSPAARNLRVALYGPDSNPLLVQDDAAFTPGSGYVVPIGALADETATDSVNEGDVGVPRMTLTRVLRTTPTGSAGADLMPDAAALADGSANPTTSRMGAASLLWNGSTWDRARTIAATGAASTTGIQAAGILGLNAAGAEYRLQVNASRDGETNGHLSGAGGMVWNGTSWDRARSGTPFDGGAGAAATGTRAVLPVMYDSTNATYRRLLTNGGDGVNSALILQTLQAAVNGSGSIDRWRNNVTGTLLSSAARTADTSSGIVVNHNARGAIFFLRVTAASGTGGLTLRIRTTDPETGGLQALNTSPTAVTVTGQQAYVIYPGANTTGVSSNTPQVVGIPLPRQFEVLIQTGDASSYTYSVTYALIV